MNSTRTAYNDSFRKALDKTAAWKCDFDDVRIEYDDRLTITQYIQQAKIFSRNFYSAPGRIEDKRKNCAGAHYILMNQMMCVGMPAILTIGDVIYEGKSVFNVSYQNLKREWRGVRYNHKEANLHVWLTLLDNTIIDLTILPYLYRDIDHSNEPEKALYTAFQGQEEQALIHKPYLTGAGLLKKSGIING